MKMRFGNVPMHLSSPLGYLLSACSPLNRGEIGPFSNGYLIVYGALKTCSRTTQRPAARGVERGGVSLSGTVQTIGSEFCKETHLE